MSQLSVVKASAGSGKTFKLTYEYIKLLMDNPGIYRHVLAVTFTNKATYEMKERILESLYTISKGEYSPYVKLLTRDTKLSADAVQKKAWLALNKVLHDYSRFSIETIDSFFQRLIRAFTREMGLNAGYRVELNTREVLDTATDHLLMRIDEDEWLKKWLTRYAENKIEDGKSWNIRDNIKHLGYALFNEAFKMESMHIQEAMNQEGFLKKYQQALQEIITRFDSTMQKQGEEALKIIRDQGLSIDDFSYKTSGVAGIFEKIQNQQYDVGSRVLKGLEDPEHWYSKASDKKTEIHDLVSRELLPRLNKIVAYIEREGQPYHTALAIRSNLYTLGILHDLLQEVEAYCREEDIFLITDSAFFLRGIIGDNDTPFIYEKVGNYYQHFMIDEFQDTSEMQYQNFRPLIGNSLSENHDNLLVGDVKQSIYRWRNSNWEIFEKQVAEDFNQLVNEYSLGKNWRSLPHIVAFNNQIFTVLPALLQDHFNGKVHESFQSYAQQHGLDRIIEKVYDQVSQEFTRQREDGLSNGYVEVCTHDLEQEEILDKLVEDIKKLQDRGYHAGDMAILVRKGKQARQVVQHLLQQSRQENGYNFSVVSNEALLINYSNAVKLVIDTLYYLVYPTDQINNFEMAYFYHQIVREQSTPGVKRPIATIDFSSHPLHTFIPQHVLDRLEGLRNLSLFEALEQAIHIFDLYHLTADHLYLNRLLDVALNFQERNGADLYLFLEYWKKEQDDLSVNPSDSQDAIQVLTIHKSKGLEFKAVLLPFCDWSLDHDRNDNILWCKPQHEPFNQLPLVPVNYSSRLERTAFAGDYYQEMIKTFIDNLNLLYVAFTRASEALIITAAQESGKKISRVNHLIQQGHQKIGLEVDHIREQTEDTFVFGDIKQQEDKTSWQAPLDTFTGLYTSQPWGDKLRIAFRGKDFFMSFTQQKGDEVRTYGQIMHDIFARITSYNDIESAVQEMYFEGRINATEKTQYQDEIRDKIMNDPVIKAWFEPGAVIYSEKTIYQKGGGVYRPDRVIRKDGQWTVIDYKFGEHPSEKDMEQVQKYLELVEEMEGTVPVGYIWYYHVNRVEKVGPRSETLNQLSIW